MRKKRPGKSRKPPHKRKTHVVKFVVDDEDWEGYVKVAETTSREVGMELSPHDWARMASRQAMRTKLRGDT